MLEYDKKRLEELEKALQIVNFITRLMQDDKIEEALPLIYLHYKDLPTFPKKVLTNNILEASKQYDLRNVEMPESFYNFLASNESDELFFPNCLL